MNFCCFKQLDMTGPSRDKWRRAADLPSGENQSSPSDARTRVKYNQFLVISSPVSFFRLFMSIIPLPHLNHVRCSHVMPCHTMPCHHLLVFHHGHKMPMASLILLFSDIVSSSQEQSCSPHSSEVKSEKKSSLVKIRCTIKRKILELIHIE